MSHDHLWAVMLVINNLCIFSVVEAVGCGACDSDTVHTVVSVVSLPPWW